MAKDYYNILGVEKTSTIDEIKKNYRKLAMKYHPDRGGDHEKFKEINEAYSVLSDENKKRQYDTYGSVSDNQFGGGGFGVDVDLSDIFEQFFGGGRSSQRQQTNTKFEGEDIQIIENIDLKTSVKGGKKTIEYKKMVQCTDCNGEGGEGKKTCNECNGSGYVENVQNTIFGTIKHTGACPNCNQTGEIFEKKCETCNGQKRIKQLISLEVDIPSGIDEGMIIRIDGKGNEGIGYTSGDLYIKFKVNSIEKNLIRKGNNLYYDLEIDLLEAILGSKRNIIIPVIGKREIIIKPGTQFGENIKMSGEGVKYIDSNKKGDLIINLNIKIPKKLSEKEKEYYGDLAKDKKINTSTKKGFFEKMFNL